MKRILKNIFDHTRIIRLRRTGVRIRQVVETTVRWQLRIACIILILIQTSHAQISVTLQPLPATLKFGDPINLQIQVEAPADGKIILPDWNEALKPFELLSAPDTSRIRVGSDRKQWDIGLKATCYESGAQALPPIWFKWVSADGITVDSASTQPVMTNISSVVPDSILAAADSTQQPHHLLRANHQWKMPYTLADFLPYIYILIGIVGLYYLIRWWVKKRRRKEVVADAGPPPEPAHVIALRALDALRDEQLYQAGKIKEYYSILTEILRRYFEACFDVPAMESTSFQLLRDIELPLGDTELLKSLETMLTHADFAKFAKHQPDATTCQQDLERAYVLVNKTKPVQQPLLVGEAA
jgi:hypothetical protein